VSPSRRDILLGGAFLTTAGLGFAGSFLNRPRALPAGGLEKLIPPRLGQWQQAGAAGIILPEEGDLSRSVYDEVLTRVYLAEGQPPIMLLIAYGGNQSGSMQLHRPEACYPAAGFALGDGEDILVDTAPGRRLPARLLQATSPERTEQILYWTRVGEHFPRSPSAQRWAVVRDHLRGEVPDGVLVRVSTIGEQRTGALPVLTGFIRDLAMGAAAGGRALLIGGGQARG
jgi:EpsI family protein